MPVDQPVPTSTGIFFLRSIPMATPAQVVANQANAKLCTGPRTAEGKAISRKNASRHGLCSTLEGIDFEDQRGQALLADLTEEHQPQGPTEEILVYKMAQQFILAERASVFLQKFTDAPATSDRAKQLPLFLRYYTTADRAFHKNLNELRKLQKERRQLETQTEIGFVSQNTSQAPAASQSPAEPGPPNAPQWVNAAAAGQISPACDVSDAPICPSEPQKQAA
jgi:hypothetical protein